MGLLALPRVAAGRDQPVHHGDHVEQPGAGRVPRAVQQLQLGQAGLAGQPQAELAGELLVAGRAGQPDDRAVLARAPRAAASGSAAVDGRPGTPAARSASACVDSSAPAQHRVGAHQVPGRRREQPGRQPGRGDQQDDPTTDDAFVAAESAA